MDCSTVKALRSCVIKKNPSCSFCVIKSFPHLFNLSTVFSLAFNRDSLPLTTHQPGLGGIEGSLLLLPILCNPGLSLILKYSETQYDLQASLEGVERSCRPPSLLHLPLCVLVIPFFYCSVKTHRHFPFHKYSKTRSLHKQLSRQAKKNSPLGNHICAAHIACKAVSLP